MMPRQSGPLLLAIALVACSCAEKAPTDSSGPAVESQQPELTRSEYTEICQVVGRFHAAVRARDIRTLRRVSPLVAFSVEEGMVDLAQMADRFAAQNGSTGNVQRIVPGGADALAFTDAPGEETAPWYYVQQHDNGNWVVQFCEEWEVESVPDLFDACRAVARKAAAAQTIRVIERALTRFRADCGALPSAEQGLGALLDSPALDGWNGPYLHLETLIDPWGTAFQYRLSEDRARITSAGPDRQPGTEDDVHVR